MSERRSGHSKLRVENGAIVQEVEKLLQGPVPVRMSFKTKLFSDGSLARFCLEQPGFGDGIIQLTDKQAESLAKEIMRRLPR